jgi:hypothetical protein
LIFLVSIFILGCGLMEVMAQPLPLLCRRRQPRTQQVNPTIQSDGMALLGGNGQGFADHNNVTPPEDTEDR